MGKKINLAGQRFGRLVVLHETTRRDPHGNVYWHCLCDCGATHETRGPQLRNGSTASCGCLFREVARQKGLNKRRHGMTDSPVYVVWNAMRDRCNNHNNPKYHLYGGRGIAVCKRWDVFDRFYQDMGDRPPGTSRDRINPDGDYEPSNCRWATQKEQQNNRTNNVRITIDGNTKTVAMWSDLHFKNANIVRQRIARGWDAKRALTTPTLPPGRPKRVSI